MSKQMIMRHSKISPFCRKVDVVAKHHGVLDGILATDVSVLDENDSLRDQNPLGKIPALILADGTNIYDSDVIVEYFEQIGSGELLIPLGETRIKTLTQYGLASGMMDAAVAVMYEGRLRPAEKVHQGFKDYQLGKVVRGLSRVVEDLPKLDKLDIANITTAVMLEYFDFRINEDMKNGTELGENKGQWRTSHPALIDWLAKFNVLCPYFAESRPY